MNPCVVTHLCVPCNELLAKCFSFHKVEDFVDALCFRWTFGVYTLLELREFGRSSMNAGAHFRVRSILQYWARDGLSQRGDGVCSIRCSNESYNLVPIISSSLGNIYVNRAGIERSERAERIVFYGAYGALDYNVRASGRLRTKKQGALKGGRGEERRVRERCRVRKTDRRLSARNGKPLLHEPRERCRNLN